jgi:NADPH-dependent curcumin reductase CurA
MTTKVNRQFRLKARPIGRARANDFDFVEAPIPIPGSGEALVRVLYLSIDPTHRIWMSDIDQYMPPVAIGEVMRGGGIGCVIASNSGRWRVGDLVSGFLGWQDYCLARETDVFAPQKLPKDLPVPLPAMLGVCGATGFTAYIGLLELGQPKAGETVVVSAAAGAVGSVAGQIAKIKGCRVVGIAGGPEKCRWLEDELGFDAAIDYKRGDWREALAAATPGGLHINFENVGGEIMAAVMQRMALGGRMVLCGLISGYNDAGSALGDFSPILMRRLNVRGFIILDFLPRWEEAAGQIVHWVLEGKLKHRETVVEGLEHAPAALNHLFDGANIGKLMVKVAEVDRVG